LRERLDAEAQERGPMEARRLEETMADVFAVLTVGPCYAMTCLFCRFDPTVDTGWLDDHPGDAERMEAILSALELVPTAGLTGIVERLRQEWQAAGDAAGDDAVQPADVEALRGRVRELLDLLVATLPDAAVYRGWARAKDTAERLAQGMEPERATLGPWDALNAGWLRRIDAEPKAIGAIAAQTAALCTDRLAAHA
jgi:hypothetical protein